MACSRGAASRIAINGKQFRFLKFENQINNPSLIDLSQQTIRGTFEPHENDIIDGEKIFRFAITIQPNPAEISELLSLMRLTNGGSGNVWTPDAALPHANFEFHVDYVAMMRKYAYTVIDKVVLQGQTGQQPFTMKIMMIAKDEEALSSWTASAILAGSPYAFRQATFTFQTITSLFYRCVVGIDFHVEDEFYNSGTATDLCPQAWDISVAAAAPFDSTHLPLYTGPSGGGTRPAGTITLANANGSTAIAFGKLVSLPKPPDITEKIGNIKLGLSWKAVKTGTTPLIQITHNAA